VLLNTISTKDFATQTTLAATLTKLGQLETELATIKANQLSGNQKVTLSGTIASGGAGLQYTKRSGALAANSTDVLFQTANAVEIYEIEFATNSKDKVRLNILVRDKDKNLHVLRVMGKNGAADFPVVPMYVSSEGSDLFQEILYDESANVYKLVFSPNKPFVCPKGCQIGLQNTDSATAFNCAAGVVFREVV
jgi:hypothetical protein